MPRPGSGSPWGRSRCPDGPAEGVQPLVVVAELEAKVGEELDRFVVAGAAASRSRPAWSACRGGRAGPRSGRRRQVFGPCPAVEPGQSAVDRRRTASRPPPRSVVRRRPTTRPTCRPARSPSRPPRSPRCLAARPRGMRQPAPGRSVASPLTGDLLRQRLGPAASRLAPWSAATCASTASRLVLVEGQRFAAASGAAAASNRCRPSSRSACFRRSSNESASSAQSLLRGPRSPHPCSRTPPGPRPSASGSGRSCSARRRSRPRGQRVVGPLQRLIVFAQVFTVLRRPWAQRDRFS